MPNPNENDMDGLTAADIAGSLLGEPLSDDSASEGSDAGGDSENAAEATGEATEGIVEGSDADLAAEAAKTEGDGAEGGAPSPDAGTAEAGSADHEKVEAEGEEVGGEGEQPQPPARRPQVEEGPSKAEVELDRRESAWEQRQAAFDAKIKAKLEAGDEYDPYLDGKEERELLREGQAITRERNRLLRSEVAESRRERQVRSHWETFHEDNPEIAAEEGRKKFVDFIRAAAKEYGPDSWSDPNNPTFNAARAVASDRFNQWVRTVKGQRKAKVQDRLPPKSKQVVKAKTPITPGGGRVTLPPQQGAVGRPPAPIPRTFEEKVAAFARNAGATPVDVLLDN